MGCPAICKCVTTNARYVEGWLPVRASGGNEGHETGSANSQCSPLLITTRSRLSTAQLCATSGHDAGQSLQPARDSRPMICSEETVAHSAV